MEKKRSQFNKESLLSLFKTRAFRAGSFSTLAGLLVIALAILVVIGVNQLPASMTHLDTTANGVFTLSQQSKDMVQGLEQDVEIFIVATTENLDPNLREILQRYADQSSHLKVTHVDPILSPNFFDQYSADNLYENSLVISSDKRYQTVNYNDIYVTDYSSGSGVTYFVGEQYVTAGIDFVVTETLPKVYRLIGHGEAYMPGSMQTAVSMENIELVDLNLVNLDAIPTDGEAVLIYSPDTDLTDRELEMFLTYLDRGGKVMLFTDYRPDPLENFLAIPAHYGLTVEEGIVLEGNADYFYRSYNYHLLPEIATHIISSPLRIGGYRVLMPFSQGIRIGEAPREGVNVTSLLSTSDSAYAKAEGFAITTFDKEPGDVEGPFCLAAAVYEITERGDLSHFVWFPTSEMLLDENNSQVSGANQDLALNALNWMCERNSSITIRGKQLELTALTVSASQNVRWSLIFVAVIPGLLLLAGITVILYRKRR